MARPPSSKRATRQFPTTSTHQIQLGNQTITYALTYAHRKSVGITIHHDLRVEVRAPSTTTPATVAEIVQQRGAWILRHLATLAQRRAARPSTKAQGGVYFFLGQQWRLTVMALPNGKGRERVALEEKRPEANAPEAKELRVWIKIPGDQPRIDALLEKWSREQADHIFTRQLLVMMAKFQGQISALPELTIRTMRARWGSCSAAGKITLNLKLIHLDLALIDYVIMHELCHLFEHNHSKNYYALLSRMMPDWKARRQRLHEIGMPE